MSPAPVSLIYSMLQYHKFLPQDTYSSLPTTQGHRNPHGPMNGLIKLLKFSLIRNKRVKPIKCGPIIICPPKLLTVRHPWPICNGKKANNKIWIRTGCYRLNIKKYAPLLRIVSTCSCFCLKNRSGKLPERKINLYKEIGTKMTEFRTALCDQKLENDDFNMSK